MGLDIRLPIGMLFAFLGLLLLGYGAVSDPVIYQRSLGFNINLWWGAVMEVFGLTMWFFGRKKAKSSSPD
jgi:hypothetical protein